MAKSPYITRSGYERLAEESQQLWQKRRQVVQILAAAAAEGDRSENAEYIYRKKQLREMDRRLRYLQKRLSELKVVEHPPADKEKVFFSAYVELEDEQGQHHRYRIVGADEFDPKKDWISVDSPLARALLGKRLDDDVQVHTPKGLRRFWIVAIEY